MDDDFLTIKNRIKNQFNQMPKTLKKYPISEKILNKRLDILKENAPNKLLKNYKQ